MIIYEIFFVDWKSSISESLFNSTLLHFITCVCVCVCVCMHTHLLSHVQLFATIWTVAHQAPLSVGFPRQEYWRGLPFPSPGDLPNTGIQPMSPAFAKQILYHCTTREAPSLYAWVAVKYIHAYIYMKHGGLEFCRLDLTLGLHFSAVQETWVQSLSQEDPLEKGMATHSNLLPWRIPWTEGPGGLQSMGSQSWTQLSDWHTHHASQQPSDLTKVT